MCCRKPAKITGLFWPRPVTFLTLVLLFTLADCSRFCRISSLTRPLYLLYLVSTICTIQDMQSDAEFKYKPILVFSCSPILLANMTLIAPINLRTFVKCTKRTTIIKS